MHTPTPTHAYTRTRNSCGCNKGKKACNECGAVANYFTAADGAGSRKKAKSRKMKTCEVWIVLHRKHEHESTSMSSNTNTSTSRRAVEHSPTLEHSSTRARARGALEHEHEHSSPSTRWSGNQCEPSGEGHAKDVGYFFDHVGLHASGWLCVLGMPPCGYLPVFATVNPQSTCHGPRPGPTLAPSCTGGLPACPGAESTRKDPRRQEKKKSMCKKTHLYIQQ